MQKVTFEKELNIISDYGARDNFFVIGVDEAGRGPLAGPVVACAASLRDFKNAMDIPERKNNYWDLVRDSKTLSEKQREKAFDFVQEHFYIGIGIVNSETIDRINILQAAFLAMKSAIQELQRNLKEDNIYLLIDGDKTIPNISINQEAIIGGDGSVKSIAAASIIAKVTRDRIMKDFDKKYPGYGFAKHKGYGTKEHLDALRRFGPCQIHRMSFRPVLLSIPENVNRRFGNVLKQKKR